MNQVMPKQNNLGYGYEAAYKLACEQLAEIDDLKQQCLKSGTHYQEIESKKVIVIEYLNQSHIISLPDIEISLMDGKEVSLRDRILVLHYLALAKGTPLTNKMLTFKDLPEGRNYFRTFSKRTIEPLLRYFGGEPHRLVDAAGSIGGHKSDYGDVSVTIDAFSKVPVTIVMWQGDAEFTPSGSIMFDASISDYLHNYDITVLCETITWRLINYLKT